jgi:hypothetical protein
VPLNYDDPFGLCPPQDDSKCTVGQQVSAAIQSTIAGIGNAIADLGRSVGKGLEAANDATVKALKATPGAVVGMMEAVFPEPHDALSAEDFQSGSTFDTKSRAAPGADGGVSRISIERDPSGQAISTTHQVTNPTTGEIIHQHQDFIGKYGGTRQFPEEWVRFPTIPPE